MKTNNLRLDYNHNGNLDCDCFSLIRPLDADLFEPETTIELYLRDQPLGQVQVLMHKELPEAKLNTWVSRLATGHDVPRARQMLRREFRTTKADPVYSWVLLRFTRRYNPEDFLRDSKPKTKVLALPLAG